MKNIFFIFLLSMVLTSCYKEIVIPEPKADIFEILVDAKTDHFIHSSRDSAYSIKSSNPQLLYNEQLITPEDIRIRGKNALNFERKSYSIFLNDAIYINNRDNTEVKKLSRFKLISLAMDYTYIENRIAFGLLNEAGLMPLFFKFVEVKMNNNTQGVYLLIEDPEQYVYEIGSEYVLRRGYHHYIADYEYHPQFYNKPEADYLESFKQIYLQLLNFQGESLYEKTSAILNIEQYYNKMAIDYLLQNGDYTDEIFFYSKIVGDSIRYNIIPWDYDDIFSTQPHELGVSWGTGTLFGNRIYKTMDDVYADIGNKLIYSIEDDLDYAIAKDSALYRKYTESFALLTEKIDVDIIEKVFRETENELMAFYNSPAVIEQSQSDQDPGDKDLWLKNMMEKKNLLNSRLLSIKSRLKNENE